MDFIVGLLRTQSGSDSIWGIVDHLTKVAHFIPIKMTDERLAPDLLRGRGKLTGGDLDIDEEGVEQNDRDLAITTPGLRWLPTCMHMSWSC
jgi:hypothetical protein